MATQHPDNAGAPFWEKDHDGFVGSHEETLECVRCLSDLGVDEFMWDWEGKYADEAVVDRLFGEFYEYFKKNNLGRKKFLTFRIPNVWKEKGYNLIRALMVVLTSEDFARDLKFHTPALFEIILPMTESAEQLIYIQSSFQKLARFKSQTFHHRSDHNQDHLEMIPLVESVSDQLNIGKLLRKYLGLHQKTFKSKPPYLRPFLARSDPALISGLVATVLANKIALSDIKTVGQETHVKMYPILGAGGLVFRGGLNPANIDNFVREYAGVRTATVQSAFRYDYPLASVKKAIRKLEVLLPRAKATTISEREQERLLPVIRAFEKHYQHSLSLITEDMRHLFTLVPRRRERRQHIGLLSYARKMGKHSLPRAINFTAAFYSIGIPPEFLGLGQALNELTSAELKLVEKYYRNFRTDLIRTGRYLNWQNLEKLAAKNSAWRNVAESIRLTEKVTGLTFGPKTKSDKLYEYLTSGILVQPDRTQVVRDLIVETGKIRRSLG